MAKPYLIYKTSNGVYYAELLLPDGTHANKKSTGSRNRAEAEKIVMGWVVNGNIPARINGKANNKTKYHVPAKFPERQCANLQVVWRLNGCCKSIRRRSKTH